MSQKIKIAFSAILVLIIMNCTSVFALTSNQFDKLLDYAGISSFKSNSKYDEALSYINQFDYQIVMINIKSTGTIDFNIFSCEEMPYWNGSSIIYKNNYKVNIVKSSSGITYNVIDYSTKNTKYSLATSSTYYAFPQGVYYEGTTDYYYSPKYETEPVLYKYLMPYFEYAGTPIGTTTLENFDGNIPCFYPRSFETEANSYATFKKIGTLYIDENYILENIYYNTKNITVLNMSQTKSWTYNNYLIFTTKNSENGYIAYDINIDINYINTPYIYTMNYESYDNQLGEDININFVLLTEAQQGGGTVVESGDTEISGDFFEDKTTTGDINNTIENIFQKPDEESLKEEQEENINQIKEQITNELEKNKVFSALTTAEQGLIELLEGEPRGFKNFLGSCQIL